jgi:hypothetical protein
VVSRKLRKRYARYGHFPAIARLENSVKIMVYARDPTHGPHVHVAYEGAERSAARLSIRDGSTIDNRAGIKPKDLAAARAWLAANRPMALAEWNRINPRRT